MQARLRSLGLGLRGADMLADTISGTLASASWADRLDAPLLPHEALAARA